MSRLSTSSFFRFLTALAVIGLLAGGVAANAAMPMPAGDMAALVADHAETPAQAEKHSASACQHGPQLHAEKCSDTTDAYQCDSSIDCCPHAGTALLSMPEMAAAPRAEIQTPAPQWRSTSVTSVTEIRPPIPTL